MSNIHNNWRKFLTEGSYNESKLLQEVSEEELEYIQTAVDEMAPEDLAFNELFGGKERVLIPFSTMDDSTELGQFLTILGKFRGNDLDISFDYVPNWEKGVMEKERSVSSKELNNMLMGGEDPKRVLQTMKIGKYLAASERAISEYAKWIKYKDDNDLGSGSRPMTTDEMEKEQIQDIDVPADIANNDFVNMYDEYKKSPELTLTENSNDLDINTSIVEEDSDATTK